MLRDVSSPVLSVVVIGRNEGERLERCLRSVEAMEAPPGGIEVIYVDSASTDGSAARAASMGARVVEVRTERPCAAVARNAGWQAARAPFVLFLDGDTILHPRFVAAALPAFADPNVAVVWGHRREMAPHASVYQRVLDLDWVYPPGRSEFCGGDAIMRRSVLEDVGGYDESLVAGEEPEMCRRMRLRGHAIEHIDHPMTLHDLAICRWSQYWRRAFRAGHAYAELAERLRGSALPLWVDVARRNRVHGAALVFLALAALIGSATLRSPLPAALFVTFVSALSVRTALRMRWKSSDPLTLLLYGVHAHLQQVPILAGQLAYHRDRNRGRRRGLIEYKGVS